jgi:DNA polymerase delta subunit 4
MPTTRRRGGQTNRSQQSTLSFGTHSRITKPSSASTTHNKKINDVEHAVKDASPSVETPSTPVEPEQSPVVPAGSSKPHIAELVVREQAKVAKEQPLNEEDRKALKITDVQIKQYWKKEEEKRKAPQGEYWWTSEQKKKQKHKGWLLTDHHSIK